MSDYDNFLDQLQKIQDEETLKDYHSFVYWFIDTVFGLEKKDILNSICDGMHDKCIDAIVINHIDRHIVIIQSKFEHEGGQRQIAKSEIKEFAATKNYFRSRRALAAATPNANQAAKRLLDNAFDLIHGKHYTSELAFITPHKEAPDTKNLGYNILAFHPNEFSTYDYTRIMQLLKDKLRD